MTVSSRRQRRPRMTPKDTAVFPISTARMVCGSFFCFAVRRFFTTVSLGQFLDLHDFITDCGGLLKLKVASGELHALLQTGNPVRQFVLLRALPGNVAGDLFPLVVRQLFNACADGLLDGL